MIGLFCQRALLSLWHYRSSPSVLEVQHTATHRNTLQHVTDYFKSDLLRSVMILKSMSVHGYNINESSVCDDIKVYAHL